MRSRSRSHRAYTVVLASDACPNAAAVASRSPVRPKTCWAKLWRRLWGDARCSTRAALHQLHYPLESTLLGVVGESEIRAHEGRELGDDAEVVYLLEGSQIGYGRAAAWDAAEEA